MFDGPLVDRLQQEVADRQPVDWAALFKELEASSSASPDVLNELSLLRLLDEIGNAHTQFQTGRFDEDEISTVIVDKPLGDTLETWGRYRLERKVGRGGFGSVYQAWDPLLQMPVAIKILHRRYSDERLRERLLYEGSALAQVRHPNVVRVLNVEEHDERLGLVMEFLSGETMDAVVTAKGKLPYEDACVVVEDVCQALSEVHAKDLIHRDVKARNIIREPDGRIVLMDFGAGLSARAAEEKGSVVGTPLYMAPETLTGAPATPASDVYSAGVLLFYLVTGRYPYEGQTVDDIRDAHESGRAHSLKALRPDLPARFVKVADLALAVRVEDRYATPADLRDGLVRARARLKWTQRLYRLQLLVVSILLLMLVGGMLSAAAFNLTFGRGDYAAEGIKEWFILGRRSLVLPVVLSLFGALVIGMALGIRNVLLPMFSGARTLDRGLRRACGAVARRLALTDEIVCASWLVVLTAVGTAGIFVYFGELLETISQSVSTASVGELALLSPPYLEYRTHYRMSLILLAACNIVGWYALTRTPTRRRLALPAWVIGAELAVLVLLYVAMQLPYRILNDHNKFPVTAWQNERCFVLGTRPQDALLFCPSTMPRIRIRQASDGPLVVSETGESMFATFAPQSR